MRYRTTLTAKAEIIDPGSQEFRAMASSLQDKYGFDLKPQMDLLYLRSCLASAGSSVGVNDNDDIFTREEAWAARHTPVLKPFNWQHNDKDILGVIFTVEARDLDGNVLDISDETPPDCDFDIYTEAAIFKLLQPDRAAEIQSRAAAGSLYVSMEAWFDDYAYGLCDHGTGSLDRVVARNKQTSFLDSHLRCAGGTGFYKDSELNADVRIGRVLCGITFGGCGLVDRPANKRSVIEEVDSMTEFGGVQGVDVEALLDKVLEANKTVQEVTFMNTQANTPVGTTEDVKAAVREELSEQKRAEAEAREQEQLRTRASDAEAKSQELEAKVTELTEEKEAQSAQASALNETLGRYQELVDKLIAGATEDTPAEIASIDAAQSGEEAFQAKLAWLEKSMASLQTRAARADELEKQLAQAEAVVREQDVRDLLGDFLSEEVLEKMVATAAGLDNDAYQIWRDEKELMLLDAAARATAGEGSDEDNPFAALLAKHRSEGGDLINPPGGEDVKSGVNPAQLKTPRHKIAGSAAGNDPASELDNVEGEDGVNYAGASVGDEGDGGVNPFRSLASIVVDGNSDDNDKSGESKPDFDPIS